MRLPFASWLVFLAAASHGAQAAWPGAEGFGAGTCGGEGGRVLLVTRLDDDPGRPQKGSLRWALGQKGPRIVRFSVGGDVMLRNRILVREPFLTLDGSTAPGSGVCIRGGSLEFRDTHDILVRHVRIRLGAENTLQKLRRAGLKRPKNSNGLDCVSLNDCRRVLFDHCSVSWSCDELFGIVRCREVTIQWCILSEPLAGPRLHPYGDDHAFGINASASTLSIHHCLITRFVMRGPQFECNDMRGKDTHTVRMEAVNNLICGYARSGSRWSSGVEDGDGMTTGKTFEFQFLNNLYIPGAEKTQPIEVVARHGQDADVRVAVLGNAVLTAESGGQGPPLLHPLAHKGPMLPVRVMPTDPHGLIERLHEAAPMTDSGRMLFHPPVPVTLHAAPDAAAQVLRHAGDTGRDDPVDARVLREVLALSFGKPVRSPGDD